MSEQKVENLSPISLSILMEEKVKASSDWLLEQLESIKPHLNDIIHQQYGPGIGKSQVQHLLRAVQNAAGLSEIELFIQYQMGRDSRRNGWAQVSMQKKFGERIIEVSKRIRSRSIELAPSWNPSEQSAFALKLMERLLVYLNWHFTYALVNKPNTNGHERTPAPPKPDRRNQPYNKGGRRS